MKNHGQFTILVILFIFIFYKTINVTQRHNVFVFLVVVVVFGVFG